MKFAVGLLISLAIATPVQPGTPSVPFGGDSQSSNTRVSLGGDSQSSTPSLPFGGDTNALEANQLCPNDLEAGQIDALSRSLDQLSSRMMLVENSSSQLYPIIRSLQTDLDALKRGSCARKFVVVALAFNLMSLWLVQGFKS